MAVSGSVGLELLHDLLPSVVVYKTSWLFETVARRVADRQHVSLVNLLAGHELYPEVVGAAWTPEQVATPLVKWLTDASARAAIVEELRVLKEKVVVPGACDRAADILMADLMGMPK